MNKDKTLKERFYEKVGLDWQWRGSKGKDGYGRMKFYDHIVDAHRISYTIHNGEIPEGICVLHSCDDPGCVNPEHLHLGTQFDNAMEKIERGRVKGLRVNQVLEIRKRHKEGVNQRTLAKEFGVNFRTISSIITGVNWKHI